MRKVTLFILFLSILAPVFTPVCSQYADINALR